MTSPESAGRRAHGGYLERPAPSGLADVVRVILNKGIVIDAYVEVSLLGIELVTLDARVTIASVETYLRFAQAANRLDLAPRGGKALPDLLADATGTVVEATAEHVVEHAVGHVVESTKEKAKETVEGAAGAVAGKLADAGEAVVEKLEGKDR